jgi:hypothetical protein
MVRGAQVATLFRKPGETAMTIEEGQFTTQTNDLEPDEENAPKRVRSGDRCPAGGYWIAEDSDPEIKEHYFKDQQMGLVAGKPGVWHGPFMDM